MTNGRIRYTINQNPAQGGCTAEREEIILICQKLILMHNITKKMCRY